MQNSYSFRIFAHFLIWRVWAFELHEWANEWYQHIAGERSGHEWICLIRLCARDQLSTALAREWFVAFELRSFFVYWFLYTFFLFAICCGRFCRWCCPSGHCSLPLVSISSTTGSRDHFSISRSEALCTKNHWRVLYNCSSCSCFACRFSIWYYWTITNSKAKGAVS